MRVTLEATEVETCRESVGGKGRGGKGGMDRGGQRISSVTYDTISLDAPQKKTKDHVSDDSQFRQERVCKCPSHCTQRNRMWSVEADSCWGLDSNGGFVPPGVREPGMKSARTCAVAESTVNSAPSKSVEAEKLVLGIHFPFFSKTCASTH